MVIHAPCTYCTCDHQTGVGSVASTKIATIHRPVYGVTPAHQLAPSSSHNTQCVLWPAMDHAEQVRAKQIYLIGVGLLFVSEVQ